MRRATIKDVAERAKVSLKTVSRVINNEPSVMQATRARVLRAIAELDYEPDPAARNLRTRHHVRDRAGVRQPQPVPHHRRAERRAGRLPRDRLRTADPSLRFQFADAGRRTGRLGAAFAPGRAGADRADVRAQGTGRAALTARGIKLVRIIAATAGSRRTAPACSSMTARAAYEITEHLIQLGHQRIGFLWGGTSHRSSGERYAGYEAALKRLRHDRRQAPGGAGRLHLRRRLPRRAAAAGAARTADRDLRFQR